MKVGDLVREYTQTNRVPDLGLIIEIDPKSKSGTAKCLVQFDDGATWMAKHHLEVINESG